MREFAFAALFVSQREVEMDVGVPGHRARGAPQMIDGLVDAPLLLKHAPQVVARDPAQRIKLDRRSKFLARFLDAAQLIQRDAKIDVRVNPVRRELENLPVGVHGLRKEIRFCLAIERVLEEFFGIRSGEGVNFGDFLRGFEGKGPLLPQRIERAARSRRYDEDVAALFNEAQFLQSNVLRAELLFHQIDGAAHAPRGNSIVGEALQRSQGDQIAEAVESFAKSCLGTN